jgi:SAM-dependent methyltransferase
MKAIPLRKRSTATVAAEWDRIAPIRARQIDSGADHSACAVLAPALMKLLGRTDSLLDVGCGTGWLSRLLSDNARTVVGVDPSRVSIRWARRAAPRKNVEFVNASIESFAAAHLEDFSAAVANMTFGTVSTLPRVLASIHRCLQADGILVFTIPHPCFWPLYWGYADAPWFQYNSEIAIAAPFRIESEGTALITTHIHRPLHQYFAALDSAGFELEQFRELTGKGFRPPRFIAMRVRKTNAIRHNAGRKR